MGHPEVEGESMFLRLLWESFARQRRRKLLAGVAILLGTTAVTAMLALATTIGDRIHRELAVYGANIVVYPKAEQLQVKVGGVDVKPATGGATLKESDLEKLHGIFWANNITGVSPELDVPVIVVPDNGQVRSWRLRSLIAYTTAVGYWFDHPFGYDPDGRCGASPLVEAGRGVAVAHGGEQRQQPGRRKLSLDRVWQRSSI